MDVVTQRRRQTAESQGARYIPHPGQKVMGGGQPIPGQLISSDKPSNNSPTVTRENATVVKGTTRKFFWETENVQPIKDSEILFLSINVPNHCDRFANLWLCFSYSWKSFNFLNFSFLLPLQPFRDPTNLFLIYWLQSFPSPFSTKTSKVLLTFELSLSQFLDYLKSISS